MHWGIVPFLSLTLGMGKGPHPSIHVGASGIRLKMGSEDALEASGRRACKEGRMPVSGDCANFKERWRRSSDPDQYNCDQHDHERHDRVHHHAQRAMIGIAVGRMDVCYLDHGQKREQNQAQDSRHSQSTLLCMGPAA